MIATKSQKRRYKLTNIIDGVATARTNKKTGCCTMLTTHGKWAKKNEMEEDECRLAIINITDLSKLHMILELCEQDLTRAEIAHMSLQLILLEG